MSGGARAKFVFEREGHDTERGNLTPSRNVDLRRKCQKFVFARRWIYYRPFGKFDERSLAGCVRIGWRNAISMSRYRNVSLSSCFQFPLCFSPAFSSAFAGYVKEGRRKVNISRPPRALCETGTSAKRFDKRRMRTEKWERERRRFASRGAPELQRRALVIFPGLQKNLFDNF